MYDGIRPIFIQKGIIMKNKLDPIGVLSESIIRYIKEALSSASFDKTQKGIITETLSDNRYKVKITQTIYTVPAVVAGNYAVGDEVYVIVPQNDPDQMFLLPIGISELDPSTTVLSVNGKTGYVNLGIPDIPGLNTELNNFVSKETGKGLSTNDYTTEEKQKLAGIEENANYYVHPATHPASMITGLAKVATTGAYEDLTEKPALKSIATSGEASDVSFMPPAGVSAANVQSALTELNDKAESKVDKIPGKGLSSNDYTEAEKKKLQNTYTKGESRQAFANAFVGEKAGASVRIGDVCENTLLRQAAVQGVTAEVLADPEAEKSPDNVATISGAEPMKLTVCGKNLFDMDRCFPGDIRVHNGITYTKTPDGILVNGTATAQSYTTPYNMVEILKIGKTYTVSTNDERAVPTIQVKSSTGEAYKRTYTVSGDETEISIYFYISSGVTVENLLVQFQLEAGSTATAYEPFDRMDDYPLPTMEPLMSLPDGVCDEYDAVTGVETRRIEKIVLDGTETLAVGTHSNGQAYGSFVIDAHTKAHSLPLSTHYLSSDWTTDNNRIYIPVYDHFCIVDSRFVSKEAAQDILSAQHAAGTPVTIYYELAEPVIIQHDPQTVPAAYPTTTVYADAGNVVVSYNRDSNLIYGELTDDLETKVDKISGKGLSTNDYTTAEKQKLAGIQANANNYTHPATHSASMVVFADGDTFQQKLDQGELKGDSFKVGESYETAVEKTFFFKLMS